MIATAVDLFYRNGFGAVGIDRVIAAAGVPAGVLGEHPLRTPDGRRELRFDERGVVSLWDWAPCPPDPTSRKWSG